jgi:hypothetical protein
LRQKEKDRLRINNTFHPAASPDLNPIENIWAILKQRLKRRSRLPTSEHELWTGLQEEWEAIPIGVVNRVIEGMERRRLAVISARGWSIAKQKASMHVDAPSCKV